MELENNSSPSAFHSSSSSSSSFSSVDWTTLDFPQEGEFLDACTTRSIPIQDVVNNWQQEWHSPQQYCQSEPAVMDVFVEVQHEMEEDETIASTLDQPILPYQSRQKGPSAEEWDRIRPVFTKLYRGQNLKLDIVMKVLSDKHDFNATRCMYTKRITDWNLHKNMKESEKVMIMDTVSKEGILPQSQRQSLRIDKLQRYRRDKSRRRAAIDMDRLGSTSCFFLEMLGRSRVLNDVPSRRETNKASIRYIKPPQETGEFMWLKEELYELSGSLEFDRTATWEMEGLLEDAINVLSKNAFGKSTILLNKFATIFEVQAQKPTLKMFYNCVLSLLSSHWSHHRDYQTQLALYMCRVLTTYNAKLARVLQVSVRVSSSPRAVAILRLIGDTFNELWTSVSMKSRVAFYERYVNFLTSHGEWDTSIALCRSLVSLFESTQCYQSNMLFLLGKALYHKGEVEQALWTFEQLEDREYFGVLRFEYLIYMASIFMERGDLVMGETCAFKALQIGVSIYGPVNLYIANLLINFIDIMSWCGHDFDINTWKVRFLETWQEALSIKQDAGEPNWPYESMPQI